MGSGRRNLDWVVAWWSETLTTSIDFELISLIAAAELEQYEEDVIVERVVGQYYLRNNSTAGPELFMLRMYTSDVDSTGQGVGLNNWLFDDANYQFMWNKVLVLDASPNAGSQNMFSGGSHPEWSHLDVKVNRRLGDLQELRMSFDALDPTVSFTWGAWIRVLVKT